MDLWDALQINVPCVVSFSGAGGKTSLILSLAADARLRGIPVVVTTTTKMYARQVQDFAPVITEFFDQGVQAVSDSLKQRGYAAWFYGREGDKVLGLPSAYVDEVARRQLGALILVEADGAREKLLKAPAVHEPVIPFSTDITVGVLSMKAVGLPLAEQTVHRVDLVCSLLGKTPGQIIELQDLALLAAHEQGLFQHSRGRRVLILGGAEEQTVTAGREVAAMLKTLHTGIGQCVIAEGYGETMKPVEVISL